MWDPELYQRFGDERSRPFFDLLGRVAAEAPGRVVDLGCGPGTLTAALARRWPGAEVRGIDSSAEMIEAAQALPDSGHRLSFALGDVRDWKPDGPVDVIISNAVLQWVPDHLATAARWAGFLPAGGWLAFQVPANFDQPSHQALRELVGSDHWRPLLAGVRLNRQAAEPGRVRGPAGPGRLRDRRVGDNLRTRAARRRSDNRLVPGHGPAPGDRGAAARPGR